jgi:hypothetical protein
VVIADDLVETDDCMELGGEEGAAERDGEDLMEGNIDDVDGSAEGEDEDDRMKSVDDGAEMLGLGIIHELLLELGIEVGNFAR